MKRILAVMAATLLGGAGWAWSAPAARAQDVAAGDRAASEQAERVAHATDELLSHLVSVTLDGATLKQAIEAVGATAGVRISYDKAMLDAYPTRITLHVTKTALGAVFDRVLAGTDLKVAGMPGNQLAIVRGGQGGRAVLQGGIVGTVTDAKTKQPLRGVSVILDDSTRGVRTDEQGRFHLANVSAGTHRLLVRMVGYARQTRVVTVTDEGTATVDVALQASTTTLDEVVTTATGDRKRLEVGNAVGTIKADSVVANNVIRNVSDLLQARIPGVVVQNTDGAVGSPSKIRLRGVSSLALNNDPIVILDGVRLNAQTTVASNQTNVGSQQMLRRQGLIGGTNTALAPSRLDDIDPNTIESIDVLRGPSASSLYGTDAANGVIVIKTKKGRPGSWRTTILADDGRSAVPGKFEELWWGYYVSNGYFTGVNCLLATSGQNVANGSCKQDSVRQFNPQNDPQMRTLGTGTNRTLSVNMSGGNEQLQQFLSVRASGQVGMAKMSETQQRNIARLWSSPAPSWMVHPNTEQDIDGSSGTTFQISPKADISLTSNAMYRNVLNGGSGMQSVTLGSGASPADTLGFLPSESQKTKLSSIAKRELVASTGNYRPLGWLSLTGNVGGDYTLRTDGADIRAQDCSVLLGTLRGTGCPSSHSSRRDETFVTTVNGGANLSFTPRPWLTLRTSLGEQYTHTNFYTLLAGNADAINCPLAFGASLLTPPPVCVDGSAQKYTVTENQDEAATAGWYVEETVGLFGLYTTFGRRQDVASAFGGQVNKSPPNYPKFNFSFPLSEQSFFPKQDWVSSLRLRLAYGQSGNQASQSAVINYFNAQQVTYGNSPTVVGLITLNQLGNPDLRPERGTEWEGGFDISFLENERVHFEATMTRKFTRDAIVSVQRALSYGVDNVSEYINLGNVENRTLELTGRFRLLDRRGASWDLTINRTQLRNKLVHKAPNGTFSGPTDNNNFTEGYPLYGLWGVPVLSYADRNGDGILAQDEIVFGAKRYMGSPFPKAEVTYVTDIAFLNRMLHVSATVDQINGQSNRFTISGNHFPRAAVDRTSSLAAQAAWIQATLNNNSYMAQTSSVRLNELSVTYDVPIGLTQRWLRAHSLALTFAGRNLALWTNYIGKDPNVDTSLQLGDGSIDNGLGTPQPRTFLFRFNLGL